MLSNKCSVVKGASSHTRPWREDVCALTLVGSRRQFLKAKLPESQTPAQSIEMRSKEFGVRLGLAVFGELEG